MNSSERLFKMIETRQGSMVDAAFAEQFGIDGSTWWRYRTGHSPISLKVLTRMIEHYCAENDAQMVGFLLAYVGAAHITAPERLGRLFIDLAA